MSGVLLGFSTIAAVIGLGALLAHLGVVDLAAQALVSRIAFFIATPALMVVTIGEADVRGAFSGNLVASGAAIVVVGVVYLTLARLLWRKSAPDAVVGLMNASYVNAGNLGIPIAAYVLKDAVLVAPMLLLQMLFLQPLALAALDHFSPGRAAGPWGVLRQVVTNPLTIGSVVGLVLALTGWTLPPIVHDPLSMVADLAVPGVLIAYGIALRLGPGFANSGTGGVVFLTSTIKLIVHPLVAWAVAAGVLGLEGPALLAIVIVAALPTAQNVFVIANHYNREVDTTRDVILVTTLGSVPVIIVIALLLG